MRRVLTNLIPQCIQNALNSPSESYLKLRFLLLDKCGFVEEHLYIQKIRIFLVAEQKLKYSIRLCKIKLFIKAKPHSGLGLI